MSTRHDYANPTQKRVLLWVFYGGLGLVLFLIVIGVLSAILPGALATRVAYNSEGYLFAVVLGSWLQLLMPRVPHYRRVPLAFIYGAFWALVGVGLLLSDLPSRIRTLNEAALALAFVIPYVTLQRPQVRRALAIVPILIALTIWAVIWAPDSWVIDHAETFGFVVLATLTFDVFDRELLDPGVRVRPGLRWGWYAFMLLEPIVVSAIGTGARTGVGGTALTLEYLGRIHESFVGVLLVALILHLVKDYRQQLSHV